MKKHIKSIRKNSQLKKRLNLRYSIFIKNDGASGIGASGGFNLTGISALAIGSMIDSSTQRVEMYFNFLLFGKFGYIGSNVVYIETSNSWDS